GSQPRNDTRPVRDAGDAGVETLPGERIEHRRERRSQHREPAQCAGVAPGHVTSCDRHDSSFALLRLLGIGILHAYRTARERLTWFVRFVPKADGSELARVFFTFAGWSVQPCVRPVSAAHRPLAIMPSADQVPVKSSHLTMRWH